MVITTTPRRSRSRETPLFCFVLRLFSNRDGRHLFRSRFFSRLFDTARPLRTSRQRPSENTTGTSAFVDMFASRLHQVRCQILATRFRFRIPWTRCSRRHSSLEWTGASEFVHVNRFYFSADGDSCQPSYFMPFMDLAITFLSLPGLNLAVTIQYV